MASTILVVMAVGRADAQTERKPTLEIPVPIVHSIALDVQGGSNPIYCYFGYMDTSDGPRVLVDSVTRVASPEECAGIGIGFVSRVGSRTFDIGALRGLIDGSPRFCVVSAFYTTEYTQIAGQSVLTARALSVFRPPAATTASLSPRS